MTPAGLSRQPLPPGRPGRGVRGSGPPVAPLLLEPVASRVPVRRESFYRRSLAVADAVALVVGLGWAGGLGAAITPALAVGLLVVWIVVAKLMGLYDRDALLIQRTATLDEAPALFSLTTLLALLAAIAQGATGEPIEASALALLWASLTMVVVVARAAARRFALGRTTPERCLVAGDADAMDQLVRRLTGNPHANSHVVGYVPLRDRVRADDPEPLGTLDDLERLVISHEVHRLIVAPRDAGPDRSLEAILAARALGVKVSLLPRIFEIVGSSVVFDEVEGMPVLGLRSFGLTRSSAAAKRVLDLAGAGLALAVASIPLAVAAAAVRLDSPGPALYRQPRIGRDGRTFEIIKLRTMVQDAGGRRAGLAADSAPDGLFKLEHDPRVTRVGRWLRRTSLDELPQLINVLRGDMSLVGARPLIPEEDRMVEGWHRRRLHIRPGITGPWQVLGSLRVPLYEMVKIDYLYVANWSLWGDIKIMLRTASYVLARRNR